MKKTRFGAKWTQKISPMFQNINITHHQTWTQPPTPTLASPVFVLHDGVRREGEPACVGEGDVHQHAGADARFVQSLTQRSAESVLHLGPLQREDDFGEQGRIEVCVGRCIQ